MSGDCLKFPEILNNIFQYSEENGERQIKERHTRRISTRSPPIIRPVAWGQIGDTKSQLNPIHVNRTDLEEPVEVSGRLEIC